MSNNILERAKKELLIIRCMLIPSFMQSHVKKVSKSIIIILFLGIILIFTSAFIPHSRENKFLTRFEFAQALAKVIKSSEPQEKYNKGRLNFPDLPAIKQSKINIILNLGIMSGYPDGKFYPDKVLRKFEVIHLLKQALQQSNYFSDNLKTIFPVNYNANRMDVSSYYKCKLLRSKDKLSDIANKGFIKPLLVPKKMGIITGTIIDAITEEIIRNAHLVINGKAILVDNEGFFKIDKSKMALDASLSFFVSAEGYRSLSFKQSRLYRQVVSVRLKPETSSLTLKAFSSTTNDNLVSFSVSINDKKYCSNELGDIQINHLKHGNYNAIFSAKGFKTTRKNLTISSESSIVKANLSRI